MGTACKGEFAHPEITEHLTDKPLGAGSSAIEVAPHEPKKLANVARAATASISVGEREHVPRPTEARSFRFFIMQPRTRNDVLPQTSCARQIAINFYGHPPLFRPVVSTCFVMDKPKGQRFALALWRQCNRTRCEVLRQRSSATALLLVQRFRGHLGAAIERLHMPYRLIELRECLGVGAFTTNGAQLRAAFVADAIGSDLARQMAHVTERAAIDEAGVAACLACSSDALSTTVARAVSHEAPAGTTDKLRPEREAGGKSLAHLRIEVVAAGSVSHLIGTLLGSDGGVAWVRDGMFACTLKSGFAGWSAGADAGRCEARSDGRSRNVTRDGLITVTNRRRTCIGCDLHTP